MNKKDIKTANDEYLKDSKDRFINILERKMKTTYIGALSEFERKFGFFWDDPKYNGNMKYDGKLSQEIRREMWSECRDRILTNGNNQFRALLNELEQYTLYWERYRIQFIMMDSNKEE